MLGTKTWNETTIRQTISRWNEREISLEKDCQAAYSRYYGPVQKDTL